jgi:hypothetical protein
MRHVAGGGMLPAFCVLQETRRRNEPMALKSRLTFALLICALAATGCGGGGSKKKSSSTASQPATTTPAPTASAQQAKQEFQAALLTETAGRAKFLARERTDARAANTAALKGDAAEYRTVVFDFDGAIRKIQLPDSVKADLNAVLDANKTLISDLDAIGETTTVSEFNRFVDRVNADYRARRAASDKVNAELEQLARG